MLRVVMACISFLTLNQASVALAESRPTGRSVRGEVTVNQNNKSEGKEFKASDRELLDGQIELDQKIKAYISDAPAPDPSSLNVECLNKKTVSEVKACEGESGFKASIVKLVRQNLAYRTGNFYSGKKVDWQGSEQMLTQEKTCNLSAGEDLKNFRGENCGSLCRFNIRVGLSGVRVGMSGCQKEQSWARGARVQIENHFKEKVFDEFKAGKISLTEFQGPKPCAPMAADLDRFQKANLLLVEKFEKNMSADALKRKCETEKLEHSTIVNRQEGVASQAVCQLKDVQSRMEVMWSSVLTCEIQARTDREIYEQSNNPNGWMAMLGGSLIGPCQGEVCIDCSESTRNRRVNRCYQTRVPATVKGILGRYTTREPIELPTR